MASATSALLLLVAGTILSTASSAAIATQFLNEDDVDNHFKKFIGKHGRDYQHGSAEYKMRKAFFAERLKKVREHNSDPNRLWKAAVTRFSDQSDSERKAVLGYRRGPSRASGAASSGQSLLEISNKKVDDEKDWSNLRVAQHVKDQGSCGSCWAVTTVSTLEAHYEIHIAKDGPIKRFSAQQTLECTPNPHECGGQGGCKGATVELGMGYIKENGIATEEEEPYLGHDGDCPVQGATSDFLTAMGNGQEADSLLGLATRASPAHTGGAAFGFHGFTTLPQNKGGPLVEALQAGPVAVSASAGPWQEYSSGVFNSCQKDAVVDHAITLYGYGTDNGVKYWKILNSWGPSWGEDGYVRLLRHDDDAEHCGWDNDPSQGLGCKGGPAQVYVCGMCGILYDSVTPHFAGNTNEGGILESISGILEQVSSKEESHTPASASMALLDSDGRVSSKRSTSPTTADNALMRREMRHHQQAQPHHQD
jgi:cathepsin L